MTQGWKIVVIVVAAVAIVSTPLVWLLDSPDSGQLVGASVQAATGIAALLWALFSGPSAGSEDVAERTGEADAADGGTAVTGVRRPGGRGSGSATAQRTGRAKATGEGSSAVSGIDLS